MRNKTPRPLSKIAEDISKDWKATSKNGIYFGAKPHLDAMGYLTNITDSYGAESADSIVRYFLANASTWRGATAKAIKAELKDMLK